MQSALKYYKSLQGLSSPLKIGGNNMTLVEEFINTATEAKKHLEAFPYSIVEIRVDKEEMQILKEIVLDFCGEELTKRINLLPAAY